MTGGGAPPRATGPEHGPGLDGDRLLRRLDELAAVSADGPGVTRLAYSPHDVAGRDLVAGWMREAGLRVEVDAAGNLLGRRRGGADLPGVLATGSHLDTVVQAGALDGAYGVVAAVEVAASLRDVPLRHDLVVIGFSNEEGARGTPGMTGSLSMAGLIGDAELSAPDDEGVNLAERLAAAGGAPDRLSAAAWSPGSLAGFLELHIEQGPVLEHRDVPIGVVEAITGRVWLDLVVTGTANHAGSTPMELRRDAAVAAARLVLAVRELGGDLVRVATAGVLEVSPGVRNVVPGAALVGVDLRDTDDARIAAAVRELRVRAQHVAADTGTTVQVHERSAVPAVPTDPWLTGCVARAARDLGLGTLGLPSGAGHDAQVMARLGPIGMIFVPSVAGVSHAPGETSRPEHLIDGARVLRAAILRADAGPPGSPRERPTDRTDRTSASGGAL